MYSMYITKNFVRKFNTTVQIFGLETWLIKAHYHTYMYMYIKYGAVYSYVHVVTFSKTFVIKHIYA